MKSKIRYVPEDIELDLGADDLGHPGGREILERHYRQSQHRRSGFSRSNPAFECMAHQDSGNPGLFLKKINDEWWAVHYKAANCRNLRIPAGMSDEHKRQAEYWARAAADAGWRTEMEHSLPTGTRPDVLIHGSVTTGIEVQCSPMAASAAVSRTRRAAAAGVTDVWFSGSGQPKWAWHVPTVLNRELGIPGEGQPWDTLPKRRSVTAAGLRAIHPAQCTPIHFSRCPYDRPRHCGKFHPKPEPWQGLTVDDVAARFPGGEIVTLRFYGTRQLGTRRRQATFLVSPADLALYVELTGLPASGVPGNQTNRRQQAGTIPCRSPQPTRDDEEDKYPFLGRWERCTECDRPYRPVSPTGWCYDCRLAYCPWTLVSAPSAERRL